MNRYTLREYEGGWWVYDNQEHLLVGDRFLTFALAKIYMRNLNANAK